MDQAFKEHARATAAKPIDWQKLAGRDPPQRTWAIKAWLGFYITLLAGRGGVGKTLLSQMIGSALVLGVPFIDEINRPFRVLMWGCEDDEDEFWRRQVAIAQYFKTPIEAFKNLVIVPRLGLENVLVSTEFGRPMYTPRLEELREQAGDLQAEAVILDNAAQVFGINANDNHQVTFALNGVSGALPGRAILLNAHPARATGSEYSGGAAWENVVRSRLYLGPKLPDQKQDEDEESLDEDVRYLARRKANYTSKDWRRFTYRNGVLVPDAVETQGGIVTEIRERASERIVLEGLKRLAEKSLTATDSKSTERFLPSMLRAYNLHEKNTTKELTEAMRRLIFSGKLRRKNIRGSGRHSFFVLEIV